MGHLGGDLLNYIPMLYQFALFNSKKIIKYLRLATPCAFTLRHYKVPLAYHAMHFGILKHIVLRSQFLNGFDQTV